MIFKTRIYIDTSVIGGCEDEEFSKWSISLFKEIKEGIKVAVISDVTLKELEKAPDSIKKILKNLPQKNVERVYLTEYSEALSEYIKNGAVSKKNISDAQHIAIATIEHVAVLVSWNFKHIVNLERIHSYNSINIKLGYPVLEIRTPREVLNEKEV